MFFFSKRQPWKALSRPAGRGQGRETPKGNLDPWQRATTMLEGLSAREGNK